MPKIGANREKIRKNRGKKEKSGRKGKNLESSFTLPLLTDRAGYATDRNTESSLAQSLVKRRWAPLDKLKSVVPAPIYLAIYVSEFDLTGLTLSLTC